MGSENIDAEFSTGLIASRIVSWGNSNSSVNAFSICSTICNDIFVVVPSLEHILKLFIDQ